MRHAIGSTSLRSGLLTSHTAIQLSPWEPQAIRTTSFSSHRGSLRPCRNAIRPIPVEAHGTRGGIRPTPWELRSVSHRDSPRSARASACPATPFNSPRGSLMASRETIHEQDGEPHVTRARIQRPPARTHGPPWSNSPSSKRDPRNLAIGFSSRHVRFMSSARMSLTPVKHDTHDSSRPERRHLRLSSRGRGRGNTRRSERKPPPPRSAASAATVSRVSPTTGAIR